VITESTTLFALLASVLALIFWLSTLKPFEKFFEYLPPVIWAYFVPMFLTTFGLTPSSSPVYDWMSRYLLPIALFLLMITVDLPAMIKLGGTAIFMMLAGTAGIVIGGPVAYLVFGSLLPPDAWQGLATPSGSPSPTAQPTTARRAAGASQWAAAISRRAARRPSDESRLEERKTTATRTRSSEGSSEPSSRLRIASTASRSPSPRGWSSASRGSDSR